MTNVIQPFHLLVITLAGWLNRHQQAVINYLIEENRVLKEQLEGQRLRFTDEQRLWSFSARWVRSICQDLPSNCKGRLANGFVLLPQAR